MYLSKTPHIARFFYPDLLWKMKDATNSIYITFDDGPDPDITPDALSLLKQYKASATFFCVGERVSKHPAMYASLLKEGHKTGNHTYNHLNGKKTGVDEYVENVNKAAELVHSGLFRPPYGQFKPAQVRKLKKNYKVVMWSVLPGDFDGRRSKEDVLERAIKYTRAGSIIVFHDNVKFKEKMLYALEGFLSYFSQKGFAFKAIDEGSF